MIRIIILAAALSLCVGVAFTSQGRSVFAWPEDIGYAYHGGMYGYHYHYGSFGGVAGNGNGCGDDCTSSDTGGSSGGGGGCTYDCTGGPPACAGHSDAWCAGYNAGYHDGQNIQNTNNVQGQRTVINVNAEKATVGSTQTQQGGPANGYDGSGGGGNSN